MSLGSLITSRSSLGGWLRLRSLMGHVVRAIWFRSNLLFALEVLTCAVDGRNNLRWLFSTIPDLVAFLTSLPSHEIHVPIQISPDSINFPLCSLKGSLHQITKLGDSYRATFTLRVVNLRTFSRASASTLSVERIKRWMENVKSSSSWWLSLWRCSRSDSVERQMPKQQRKVFVTIRETLADARFGCIPTNILVINMMLEKGKQKVQSRIKLWFKQVESLGCCPELNLLWSSS